MLEDNEAKCCFTSSRITLNSIGLKAIVKRPRFYLMFGNFTYAY